MCGLWRVCRPQFVLLLLFYILYRRRGVQILSELLLLVLRSTREGRQQPLIPIIHFHPHFHSGTSVRESCERVGEAGYPFCPHTTQANRVVYKVDRVLSPTHVAYQSATDAGRTIQTLAYVNPFVGWFHYYYYYYLPGVPTVIGATKRAIYVAAGTIQRVGWT